jgi:hypothetical protein
MRISLSILVGGLLFLATTLPAAAQSPPKPRDTTIVGPQTFAMILGISKYKYVRPLTYAVQGLPEVARWRKSTR